MLADGNVEAFAARDSVIVARGVVRIHGLTARSVIAAGTLVQIQGHDGLAGNLDASVIASRGWAYLNVTHCTLVAAPAGVTIGGRLQVTNDLWVINGPVPGIAHATAQRRPRAWAIAASIFRICRWRRRLEHPLDSKLRVLTLTYSPIKAADAPFPSSRRAEPAAGVTFEYEGRRLIADLGRPIVDEAGAAVQALRGWKVSWIGASSVVFSGPEADAVVAFASTPAAP